MGIGLLLGISVLRLGLSMLFDGVNTLVLPNRLVGFTTERCKPERAAVGNRCNDE